MVSEKKSGYCKLTGKFGPYVRSHILPLSLTKPSIPGESLTESTKGRGFKRKWSSWYDDELVVRDGEDILARIDDNAIRELRKHHLLWSSWLAFKPYFEPISLKLPHHTIRRVRLENPQVLQLFFLSIAWRAAASKRPEMDFVKATDAQLEKLRRIVVGEVPPSLEQFPTSLVQLSTEGPKHNLTPVNDIKRKVSFSGSPTKAFEIVRIYLDGLICHMHWNSSDFEQLAGNALLIGGAEELIVAAVTFEASKQYDNLLWNGLESLSDWSK